MKIGLVGEAPNDSNAIKNLLNKKYGLPDYLFYALLNNIHGSQLDNQKTKRLLRIEYEIEKPDIVIFIRDLDGTLKKNTTLKSRNKYFGDCNKVVDKKGIFLLNIYEIEALIISDIETFNRFFNCQLTYEGDPMEVKNPKEDLKSKCHQFKESLNPDIFELLTFETVKQNCTYFNTFILKFERKTLHDS